MKKKIKKCKHKHRHFIGYKPESNGKHNSEIWKCYSCEKFILVEVKPDWENAKTLKQGDFDMECIPWWTKNPTLKEYLREENKDFQHHSGV